MDADENAPTTPQGRLPLVERLAAGWTVAAVAAALGTSPRTVRKWRDRFAAEGEAGLRDGSCRRHCSPSRLSAAAEAEIAALRR
ncbi:helix-turn-helix domain-containing protein [Elioraea tepida]|uniref:Helix-turn-helix domain-containing protein n=1 Tax=Elioraea tepida TaxID=2843330 RepID=A0A975U1R8_9PROT|nr:helix-turn-helix domain-containing protein [Elioraea tepida]QXM24178.1 helix-turn-helix domain-containing protein [Elioraea tepida]